MALTPSETTELAEYNEERERAEADARAQEEALRSAEDRAHERGEYGSYSDWYGGAC